MGTTCTRLRHWSLPPGPRLLPVPLGPAPAHPPEGQLSPSPFLFRARVDCSFPSETYSNYLSGIKSGHSLVLLCTYVSLTPHFPLSCLIWAIFLNLIGWWQIELCYQSRVRFRLHFPGQVFECLLCSARLSVRPRSPFPADGAAPTAFRRVLASWAHHELPGLVASLRLSPPSLPPPAPVSWPLLQAPGVPQLRG